MSTTISVSTQHTLCHRCFGRGFFGDPDQAGDFAVCPRCRADIKPISLPPYDVWVVWNEGGPGESFECIGKYSSERQAWIGAAEFQAQCRQAVRDGTVMAAHFDNLQIKICGSDGEEGVIEAIPKVA